MGDALAVRLVERIGDRDRHLERLVERQRPRASRAASVSPSRYSITRKSVSPSPADVVQRADVRMVQRGDGLRFALEALLASQDPREKCGGRTLMATVRFRRVSVAL